MKSLFFFPRLIAAVFVMSALTSCTDYGKKVTFTSNKGEVYYKGDGVTEADAKSTGKFLEDNQYFLKDDKERSVQISKKDNRIQCRLVVDEKGLASIEDADGKFALLGAMMSKAVFNNTPVDIIYTDNKFSDKKTIPFNSSLGNAVDISSEIKNMKKRSYMANTLYYAPDIEENAADTIEKYLVKSEFFTPKGNNDILLSKSADNGAHFRFPVKASFANEAGLQKVEDFAKQLKADMFEGVPMQFEVLDENLKTLKTFNYEAGTE